MKRAEASQACLSLEGRIHTAVSNDQSQSSEPQAYYDSFSVQLALDHLPLKEFCLFLPSPPLSFYVPKFNGPIHHNPKPHLQWAYTAQRDLFTKTKMGLRCLQGVQHGSPDPNSLPKVCPFYGNISHISISF